MRGNFIIMPSSFADLPLHYGKVPEWLAVRMRQMGGLIINAIVHRNMEQQKC